jgi:pyruvate,water dikinase
MLTLEEITASQTPDGLAALAADRRARRDGYAAHRIGEQAWQGMPTLVPVGATVEQTRTEVVGTPVYPGVVEGVVRIIANPSEIDEVLTHEDVIVARTTDPGWASIMLTAGAFVIDIGNPMSHAAVVARELGVPCVIGTENGTSVFRNGQRVRVDGRSGRVSLLSTAEGKGTL